MVLAEQAIHIVAYIGASGNRFHPRPEGITTTAQPYEVVPR